MRAEAFGTVGFCVHLDTKGSFEVCRLGGGYLSKHKFELGEWCLCGYAYIRALYRCAVWCSLLYGWEHTLGTIGVLVCG